MNKFNIEMGRRIKEKRINLKLTRELFSSITGISEKFIYDIEVGNKGMSSETLFKIAFALGLSLDWLLNDINIEAFFFIDNNLISRTINKNSPTRL